MTSTVTTAEQRMRPMKQEQELLSRELPRFSTAEQRMRPKKQA